MPMYFCCFLSINQPHDPYNLMIDKFSQVAENLPAADRDADRQYHVINGYPVVFSFSKEPNPEAFERIRNILLATSYTKKVG